MENLQLRKRIAPTFSTMQVFLRMIFSFFLSLQLLLYPFWPATAIDISYHPNLLKLLHPLCPFWSSTKLAIRKLSWHWSHHFCSYYYSSSSQTAFLSITTTAAVRTLQKLLAVGVRSGTLGKTRSILRQSSAANPLRPSIKIASMDLAPDFERLVLPKLRKQDASVHFPTELSPGSWRCLS